jgi:hypothetical protein
MFLRRFAMVFDRRKGNNRGGCFHPGRGNEEKKSTEGFLVRLVGRVGKWPPKRKEKRGPPIQQHQRASLTQAKGKRSARNRGDPGAFPKRADVGRKTGEENEKVRVDEEG